MHKHNALAGALIADAAALGLHWLYDQEHIARIESTGSLLFRQPDSNMYQDVKGYFAQGARRAGQLSHYGESARIVGQLCAEGQYSVKAHQEAFFKAFGPCGTFNGYADRPTKALIGKMLTNADELANPSGADDDQFPGLCPVAGMFAHGYSAATTMDAVEVISVHELVAESAEALYTCLELLSEGVILPAALKQSADASTGPIGKLLQEAVAIETYDPLQVAQHYGLACHMPQGMPVVWHILSNVESFGAAIYDNVKCGGDSCGRAMVLGAIAGMAFNVPATLQNVGQKLTSGY